MKKIVSYAALFTSIILIVGITGIVNTMSGQNPSLTPPQGYSFRAQAPPPVRNANFAVTGTPGQVVAYYWIVARYASGQVRPLGPVTITNVPTVLGGPNTVILRWNAPSTTITGYDVLKTSTPVFPFTCGACKLASAITVLTATDAGGGLAANTVSTSPNVTGTVTLDNSGTLPRFVWDKNMIVKGGGISQTKGGNTPSWKSYTVTAIAGALWHITVPEGQDTPPADVAMNAGGLTQDITMFTLPANGWIERVRVKSNAACPGPATAKFTDVGLTGNNWLLCCCGSL